MSIIERIYQISDFKGDSIYKISKEIGVSNGYFAKTRAKNGSVGGDIIEKIVRYYNDLNIEWLITGKGEMLKPSNKPYNIKSNNSIVADSGSNISGNANNNVVFTGDISSPQGNNTEDIDNLLSSYNKDKGIDIDRLQVLYTSIIEGKDSIIQENNHLIQELKNTVTELREENSKSAKKVIKKNDNLNDNLFDAIPNVQKRLSNTEVANSSSVLQAKEEVIAQLKEQIEGLKQDKELLKQDKERAYKDKDSWEHRYNIAQLEIDRLKKVQDLGDTHADVG